MQVQAAGMMSTTRVPHPTDVNRILGSFAVRYLDREDGVTFTARQQFVTGGRVGARLGYDTLRQAMADLTIRTAGEHVPAAAVIERDGRYYGRELKGRRLEPGMGMPLEQLHLEPDERVEVRNFRAEAGLHERLRAIVDGVWSHRFRAPRP